MIKLSVSSKGYVLIRDGKLVEAKGFNRPNTKSTIFKNITAGLVKADNFVKHTDILVIDLSDSKVYKWVKEGIIPKNYEKDYISYYETLNRIRCQVRFVLSKSDSVKNYDLEYDYIKVADFDMEG